MNSKKIAATIAAPALAFAGLLGMNIASADIILNPGNSSCSAYLRPPSGPSQPRVEASFMSLCATGDVDQLYKVDYDDGVETGPYSASYETSFSGDPNFADIVWQAGNPFISGYERLFVLAKDGNHNPSYYGWELTGSLSWDGQETLSLSQLWYEVGGAISNVSIWGIRGTTTVPEPSSMLLLGLGIIGAGVARRRGKPA